MYVMVVDDNEATRKRSMEILDKFQIGGQTFLYHSGRKAVDHVMCNPVDFAFVRRKLPDLSGEEVEERIRFLQPITKVYLMDEGEEILVSPCGEISIGAPYPLPVGGSGTGKAGDGKSTEKNPGKRRTRDGKNRRSFNRRLFGRFRRPTICSREGRHRYSMTADRRVSRHRLAGGSDSDSHRKVYPKRRNAFCYTIKLKERR